MPYFCYLDGALMPITPSKLDLKINGANKSMTLINEGEVNIIKTTKLTEISFTLVFPMLQAYPFAVYENGFKQAKYYLDLLEDLKKRDKPFQFKLTRTRPDYTPLFDTTFQATLEKYTLKEDAKEGMDISAAVTLKQYREYGTKVLVIKPDASAQVQKPATPPPDQGDYTIKSGDTLWAISKRFLGDSARWKEIYTANEAIIEKTAQKYKRKSSSTGHWIYPGCVIKIPAK